MPKVKLLTEAEIVACGSEILRAVHVGDDRRAEAMRALALARWARKAYARLAREADHTTECNTNLCDDSHNGDELIHGCDGCRCTCGLSALLNEIEEPTP